MRKLNVGTFLKRQRPVTSPLVLYASETEYLLQVFLSEVFRKMSGPERGKVSEQLVIQRAAIQATHYCYGSSEI